jgi:hypothetical protein
MLVVDKPHDFRSAMASVLLFVGAPMDLDGDGLGVTHQGYLGGGLPASQRMDQRRGFGQPGIVDLRAHCGMAGPLFIDRHPSGGRSVGDQPPGLRPLPSDVAGQADQALDLLQFELA